MTRFRVFELIVLVGLVGLVASACTPAATKNAEVAAPVMPVLPAFIETAALPVAASLPRETEVDAVGLAIVEARMRFEKGEELYRTGVLPGAKVEFDAAMDRLLEASALHPDNDRILNEVNDLASRIHILEIAAIRDNGGLIDPQDEPAAIDDLQNIPTFPAIVDPELKEEVEEDIKDITYDLPIEINNRVLSFLEYYSKGRGRGTISVGLQRVGRYRPMIERILSEEGVPLDLIYVAQAESAFLPRALSRAKAKGMWQFISSRGKEYGLRQNAFIDERSDPEKATRAAARHLKDLYVEFGDWYLAMAAYNSGPARVSRAMKRTGGTSFWQLADKNALPKETINYVPNILALTIIGKNPEKYGFVDVVPQPPLETDRVQVSQATDLRVIAETLEIPVEQVRELNPHVLRWTTPPNDADFELMLPKGYTDKYVELVASLPESKRILWREHSVKRGETLSVIAKKYGTTVAEITQANNISARKALQIGQDLLIPVSGVAPAAASAKPAVAAASAPTATPVKASAAPTGTPAATTTTYTIKRGDTLSTIASRFKVTVNDLKSWNKLSSTRIVVGKKLVVAQQPAAAPAVADGDSVVHQVQRGETLGKIATTYKTTVDAILSWNKRNDLSVIHPGDQITIFLGSND